MEFARKHKEEIIEYYVNQEKSTYETAELLNTNPTKIRRALKFLGVHIRGYAEAQANALASGRSSHPTKGRSLSSKHKHKIGRSRSEAWAALSDEEREKIAKMNKAQWDAMSSSQKEDLRKLAVEAVREASKSGSKSERYLKNTLESDGYTVMFHKTNLVPGSNLEVDLFLPEVKTAIEIDGPSHFLDIWGAEKLQKQQNADNAKQGILLSHGYAIIRVRQLDKNVSLTKMADLSEAVLHELKAIEKEFPKPGNRLIEIEVKDGETRRI